MPSATRKGREGRGEAPRDCEVHVKWNICLICMMQTPKKKHYGPNNILFCYVLCLHKSYICSYVKFTSN